MHTASALQVLVLPGWQNSGPDHWQSRWQALYGYQRVEQHDWQRPKSGDWNIQLEEAILAIPETQAIVLVAHSLGCQLVARWASHSQNGHRVQAALLVAPPDVETEQNRHLLPSWQPIVLQRLPFASVVLASTNDPFCSLARAHSMATHWGAQLENLGALGHINSDSGLGDWAAGHQVLQRLIAQTSTD